MAKKTTQRRFVLSIASASAVAAGCPSTQPIKHGLVANPHPDSGSPAADGGPVAYGLFPQPPVDGGTGPNAADSGVQYHGVMIQPADSGPPQFHGVVVRPMCADAGLPKFLGVVIRPSDGGTAPAPCVPPDAGK
ncbi:MAG TPA: hypothetical protein VF331_14995 [Polyangiales bacterium]